MCTSPTSDFAIYRQLVRHARPIGRIFLRSAPLACWRRPWRFWHWCPFRSPVDSILGSPRFGVLSPVFIRSTGTNSILALTAGSFQLAFALLDEVPDVTEKTRGASGCARAARSILRSFVRISGWIAGASGFSFHIRAGSRIEVAGVTGAGKNHVG